jgi:hypothetical protein
MWADEDWIHGFDGCQRGALRLGNKRVCVESVVIILDASGMDMLALEIGK